VSSIALHPARGQGQLELAFTFGNTTYAPGTSTANWQYDSCIHRSSKYHSLHFNKDAPFLGKVVWINGSGNWIAAFEDAASITWMSGGYSIASAKKNYVKNTSGYYYTGYAAAWEYHIECA
jgi:hypothetical protein